MIASADLPPLRVIAAALRTTTERLVREVVNPLNTAPRWNDFEWAVARAVCAMQGISGLLGSRLRWRGPSGFDHFLAIQHAHTVTRHAQIGQLLAKLDTAHKEAGIAFVALKGSAIRALQLHQPGERPQSDIDLLIDPADALACGAVLEKLGYELRYSLRRHDVYAPVTRPEPCPYGESPGNPLKIEVHASIAEPLPVEAVNITASIFPALRIPGANPYASLGALMRHLCLHAAGNMRANAMRFIQIYEVALLAGRMTPADWAELLGDDGTRAQAWWLYPPLVLAARYIPGCVPEYLLAELRSICPLRLRNRYERVPIYEVSWSNLRIAALPGREWSRSFADSLRFARSRLWPDRAALDELTIAATAEAQFRSRRWYDAPHFERIVRWLFSHPPRVQTIAAVSAALRDTS